MGVKTRRTDAEQVEEGVIFWVGYARTGRTGNGCTCDGQWDDKLIGNRITEIGYTSIMHAVGKTRKRKC